MFLEVSPGDYLTLTAAPDTPGDIQSVNSPGAACCLMGTTTSPRTDKMPGNACGEVRLADDLAGPVHVSYLSPRVEGAKKCCPEHLATLPADRHVLSFLDHVTFYFILCHSSLLCPLPLKHQATSPIIIHFQGPFLPPLDLLAVRRKLALVGVLALPAKLCDLV